MKIWVSVGEASGDERAGEVITALQKRVPELHIRGIGGPRLLRLGMQPIETIDHLGHLGFVEVVRHIPFYVRLLRRSVREIQAWQPDVVLLVDYPGFHLQLVKRIARQVPTVYYILPQVWAWMPSRARRLKEVALALAILPFEPEFFRQYGVHAEFVGHPLVDRVRQHQPQPLEWENYIALLPGSRRREVENLFSLMLEVVRRWAGPEEFVVAAAPTVRDLIQQKLEQAHMRLPVMVGRTYDVLAGAQSAIVTSGTATLETALWKVPQVVVYKGAWLSYWIAKRLVRVSYISLPNLILNQPLLEELIQERCTADQMLEALVRLKQPSVRKRILQGYERLATLLGPPGVAERVSEKVLEVVENISSKGAKAG